MTDNNYQNILDRRYEGTFTLLDVYNDPMIHENLETLYVPEVKITDHIFIKKDASIAVTDNGPQRIRFIYLDKNGRNVTDPEATYIQIPNKCKGFLARVRIPMNQYVASSLELDYLIDIEKIQYKCERIYSRQGDSVVESDILKFENIDFSKYTHVNIDNHIKEFILNKGIIFSRYF